MPPENSLPAFGAAVAMGAEEIEFDFWFTKDGEVVSIHDSPLDRASGGTGNIWSTPLTSSVHLTSAQNTVNALEACRKNAPRSPAVAAKATENGRSWSAPSDTVAKSYSS